MGGVRYAARTGKVRSVQCQELRSPLRPVSISGLWMPWNRSPNIVFATPRSFVTTACAGMPKVARLPRSSARQGLIRRSSATSVWNVASPAGRQKMRKSPRNPLGKTRRIRESRFRIFR
ncbi:hypothetical protein BIFCAT_01454 [Bifidobacterium catenulatum DSM 16992 = JCM 1194 = LMG 11043]|uniref:Uncharacterized protein n=1 Tax=Bifidobacterium catenulatum DSM 16992 = JCM 1194 = LMG 11043 TaxID=566552 RepID=B6XW64_9BIFI|nr:hypothetical protein BIFCAT_01454 [Bifidobacterium catenulatum DSM 16992 = JCM 1194 = LMG 11043]